MTLQTSLIDSGLRNWRSNVDRAGKVFGNLSQEQLLQEVAPGKNRLIYLWVTSQRLMTLSFRFSGSDRGLIRSLT
jgi:hypothetical protein